MAWVGKWMTGIQGSKKLSELNDIVDSKFLKIANERGPVKKNNFQSWMSNGSKFESSAEILKKLSYQNQQSSFSPFDDDNLDCHRDLLSDNKSEGIIFHPVMKIANDKDIAQQSFYKRINHVAVRLNNSPFKLRILSLIQDVIPVSQTSVDGKNLRYDGNGISSLQYKKSIFLSLPKPSEHSQFELALNFVHELGHQALMVYQNADRLIAEDLDTPVYSVIRNTKRPSIMSLHALAATAYMVELCIYSSRAKYLWDAPRDYFLNRFDGLLVNLQTGIRDLLEIRLTQLGSQILQEFSLLLLLGNSTKERLWDL